jgi:hypothetical protein
VAQFSFKGCKLSSDSHSRTLEKARVQQFEFRFVDSIKGLIGELIGGWPIGFILVLVHSRFLVGDITPFQVSAECPLSCLRNPLSRKGRLFFALS